MLRKMSVTVLCLLMTLNIIYAREEKVLPREKKQEYANQIIARYAKEYAIYQEMLHQDHQFEATNLKTNVNKRVLYYHLFRGLEAYVENDQLKEAEFQIVNLRGSKIGRLPLTKKLLALLAEIPVVLDLSGSTITVLGNRNKTKTKIRLASALLVPVFVGIPGFCHESDFELRLKKYSDFLSSPRVILRGVTIVRFNKHSFGGSLAEINFSNAVLEGMRIFPKEIYHEAVLSEIININKASVDEFTDLNTNIKGVSVYFNCLDPKKENGQDCEVSFGIYRTWYQKLRSSMVTSSIDVTDPLNYSYTVINLKDYRQEVLEEFFTKHLKMENDVYGKEIFQQGCGNIIVLKSNKRTLDRLQARFLALHRELGELKELGQPSANAVLVGDSKLPDLSMGSSQLQVDVKKEQKPKAKRPKKSSRLKRENELLKAQLGNYRLQAELEQAKRALLLNPIPPVSSREESVKEILPVNPMIAEIRLAVEDLKRAVFEDSKEEESQGDQSGHVKAMSKSTALVEILKTSCANAERVLGACDQSSDDFRCRGNSQILM